MLYILYYIHILYFEVLRYYILRIIYTNIYSVKVWCVTTLCTSNTIHVPGIKWWQSRGHTSIYSQNPRWTQQPCVPLCLHTMVDSDYYVPPQHRENHPTPTPSTLPPQNVGCMEVCHGDCDLSPPSFFLLQNVSRAHSPGTYGPFRTYCPIASGQHFASTTSWAIALSPSWSPEPSEKR